METRANYVLIGAFALAGFFGLIGFFLWFARVELDRQFAYYDVRFESVSGLARASEVRFAGLPVGSVVDVRLSTEDGRVVVRLEVAADLPVRTGSVATIEAQGVTGVSFVGISAGAADQPLLRDTVEGVPEITAGRSVLQSLTEDAPEILAEALDVVRMLGELFTEENRGRVEAVLVNLEESSGDLGQALQDFAAITGIVGAAATDIAFFTTQLEPLVGGLEQTLQTADSALATVADVGDRLTVTLDQGDAVLAAALSALEAADQVARTEVPPLIEDLRGAALVLRTELEGAAPEARALIAELTATGAAATARLTEAEALVARVDAALAGVERTAAAAETFLSGEGTALASAATQLAEQDIPRLLADLRSAAASARIMADDVANLIALEVPRVIDDLRRSALSVEGQIEALGGDARVLMAEFTATGAAATARLTEAEAVLAAVESLAARLETSLDGVDRTTGAVEALVAGEGAALVAEARALIGSTTEAVAAVNRIAETDLPVILADVRAAAGTTARVVEEVGADLTAAAGAAARTVEEVGGDLTTAAGRVDGLATSAEALMAELGATFARANGTLEAIDAALATGERTLEAAERTFAGAERVLEGDVAAVAADLRSMIAQLEATLARVADDVPAITADLRAAAAAADVAFAEFEAMAREARGPVRDFAAGALPQISQLAREARSLVNSFDRLVSQLERDPSRVLFSRPTPEFRR